MNPMENSAAHARVTLSYFLQGRKRIPVRISFCLSVILALLMTDYTLSAADSLVTGSVNSGAPVQLVAGWSVLKEGTAEGTAEIDAKHPTNPDPHLLKIAITKFPAFGQGRLGLKNSIPIGVKQGQSYDITFSGVSEGIGVGLVFSLETDDGKVLARTTLPEIGRGAGGGRGGRGGRGIIPNSDTTNAASITPQVQPWRKYLLSVKATASSPDAHLTVTSIEPVPVWIENLTIEERK